MKNTDQQSDWSRARGLLADLRTTTRRSLSAQVLLGKELLLLKKKLGFEGSGRRPKEKPHVVVFVRNWNQWCSEELGISDETSNRWIQCFEAALKRAKARKSKEPEACRLLEIPAAELTGDELEKLAACIDRLVDNETQAGLLEELGIVKPGHKLTGGDTSQFKNSRNPTAQEWAQEMFQRIPREVDKLEGAFRFRDAPDYRLLLLEIPLDSPVDGEACLMGIKECLERVLSGGVAKILADVDAAIEAKMHGTPPQRTRKKSPTLAKK